jgi:hypothetical protein
MSLVTGVLDQIQHLSKILRPPGGMSATPPHRLAPTSGASDNDKGLAHSIP